MNATNYKNLIIQSNNIKIEINNKKKPTSLDDSQINSSNNTSNIKKKDSNSNKQNPLSSVSSLPSKNNKKVTFSNVKKITAFDSEIDKKSNANIKIIKANDLANYDYEHDKPKDILVIPPLYTITFEEINDKNNGKNSLPKKYILNESVKNDDDAFTSTSVEFDYKIIEEEPTKKNIDLFLPEYDYEHDSPEDILKSSNTNFDYKTFIDEYLKPKSIPLNISPDTTGFNKEIQNSALNDYKERNMNLIENNEVNGNIKNVKSIENNQPNVIEKAVLPNKTICCDPYNSQRLREYLKQISNQLRASVSENNKNIDDSINKSNFLNGKDMNTKKIDLRKNDFSSIETNLIINDKNDKCKINEEKEEINNINYDIPKTIVNKPMNKNYEVEEIVKQESISKLNSDIIQRKSNVIERILDKISEKDEPLYDEIDSIDLNEKTFDKEKIQVKENDIEILDENMVRPRSDFYDSFIDTDFSNRSSLLNDQQIEKSKNDNVEDNVEDNSDKVILNQPIFEDTPEKSSNTKTEVKESESIERLKMTENNLKNVEVEIPKQIEVKIPESNNNKTDSAIEFKSIKQIDKENTIENEKQKDKKNLSIANDLKYFISKNRPSNVKDKEKVTDANNLNESIVDSKKSQTPLTIPFNLIKKKEDQKPSRRFSLTNDLKTFVLNRRKSKSKSDIIDASLFKTNQNVDESQIRNKKKLSIANDLKYFLSKNRPSESAKKKDQAKSKKKIQLPIIELEELKTNENDSSALIYASNTDMKNEEIEIDKKSNLKSLSVNTDTKLEEENELEKENKQPISSNNLSIFHPTAKIIENDKIPEIIIDDKSKNDDDLDTLDSGDPSSFFDKKASLSLSKKELEKKEFSALANEILARRKSQLYSNKSKSDLTLNEDEEGKRNSYLTAIIKSDSTINHDLNEIQNKMNDENQNFNVLNQSEIQQNSISLPLKIKRLSTSNPELNKFQLNKQESIEDYSATKNSIFEREELQRNSIRDNILLDQILLNDYGRKKNKNDDTVYNQNIGIERPNLHSILENDQNEIRNSFDSSFNLSKSSLDDENESFTELKDEPSAETMELYHKFKNTSSISKPHILNEEFEIKELVDNNKKVKETPSKSDFKSKLDNVSLESLSTKPISNSKNKNKKKSRNIFKKIFKKRLKSSKK